MLCACFTFCIPLPPKSTLLPYTTLFRSTSTVNWWNTSWIKRKTVILNNTGSDLTNFQVKVTIPYDSDMQADFDDLRFRSEEHTSELQSLRHLVCRLLLEKKKK